MIKKVTKNKSEDNIKEIINFYDNIWNEEKKRDISIGRGYEQSRIHSTVLEFLNIKENDLVLEIGYGPGDLTKKLSKECKKSQKTCRCKSYL